jgi:hypothetical protein
MKTQKKLTFVVALMSLSLFVGACSKAGSSPTATAKAYYDAIKSKDVKTMKSLLSKGSLAMMESFAKIDNKSLDDMLKEPESKPTGAFEARNEVITGDTAMLEVKDEKGKWEKLPFVKEDGQWKIAVDKAFEQGMGEMSPGGSTGGSTGTTPGGSSMGGNTGNDTNSNTHGGMNSNKSEADDDDDTDNGNNSNHDGH